MWPKLHSVNCQTDWRTDEQTEKVQIKGPTIMYNDNRYIQSVTIGGHIIISLVSVMDNYWSLDLITGP